MTRTTALIGLGTLLAATIGACTAQITETDPTVTDTTTFTETDSCFPVCGPSTTETSIVGTSTTDTITETTTSDGGGSPGARPPESGPPNPGDGPGVAFAVSKLYLGDRTRSGHRSSTAWKSFGYDVDGQTTDCVGTSCNHVTDHCQPARNASKAFVYPDGDHGIDNSFGANILPILSGIRSDAVVVANQAIRSGATTLLIDVATLGSQSGYAPLTSRTYVGGVLGGAPRFDGTDVWPVTTTSVTDPADITSARSMFLSSYVANDTWVSGQGHLTLPLAVGAEGQILPLEIGAAVASFEMSTDHTRATNGVISGVLDPVTFSEAIRQYVGGFDDSLCDGATLESVLVQVFQASDLMKDGSPGTADEVCDGISIGLGFDASRVQLGAVAAPVPPSDVCTQP